MAKAEEEHTDIIEGDEEKSLAEIKLKELEKTFISLRMEVESAAN